MSLRACEHGMTELRCPTCTPAAAEEQMQVQRVIEEHSRQCNTEGCDSRIFFAKTRKSKTVPIECAPVSEGRRFRIRRSGNELFADYIDAHDDNLFRTRNDGAGELAFRTHIGRCAS